MATFITLVNLTEQGVRDFKASPDRAEKFKAGAQKAGVTVKEVYWTMGRYDVVMILEGPDDKTVAGVLVGLASLGNVKTQTMRGFQRVGDERNYFQSGKVSKIADFGRVNPRRRGQ